MGKEIVIGTGQSTGMGDILLLTAICKHIPDCIVELKPELKKFERFFFGQCKSLIYKDEPLDLKNTGNVHYAKAKMAGVGMGDLCYLPKVQVSKEEIDKGKKLIAKFKNPVAFVPNTSAKFKSTREIPVEVWNEILDKLKEKHDILQFGLSSNFTEFSQATPILDLDITELICYYSAIGSYYGVETGDKHLMLACGGTINVARSKKYIGHYRWIYETEKEKTICLI